MAKIANSIDYQVGFRVKSLRRAAELSERDAAFMIGVSLADYEALEAGIKRFHPRHLFSLATRFGVEMRDIFNEVGEPDAVGFSRSNVVYLFPTIQ